MNNLTSDTVKLLKECDAGIKMGISSIENVIDDVQNKKMKNALLDCKAQHEKLATEMVHILNAHGDTGKNPNPMAKRMSWVKTNIMLATNASDNTIANLITDGCNMGVKSLNKYLNQYKNADNVSKDITNRLADMEEKLSTEMREYL